MSRFITIVSGLPRSGTSMMMQMLAAGGIPPLADDIRPADDDNPRGYFEFERVKQVERDASWLDEAEGKAVKMVYRLLYNLPSDYQYRVVFMIRPLDEVIASQRVMLVRNGKASDRLDDARLAEIYRHQLEEVVAWLQTQPNVAVLLVNYHDVLADPDRGVRRLSRFLSDRLDTDAMLRVPDWSLYRQRLEGAKAVGTGTVSRGARRNPREE